MLINLCAFQITDTDILNFALNLEYLEAQYYSWSVFGHGIPAKDTGGNGVVTGAKKATLSAPVLVRAWHFESCKPY